MIKNLASLFIPILISINVMADSIIYEKRIYKTIPQGELIAHTFYSSASAEAKNKTTLALFHGGGWSGGKPDEFFSTCRRYAAMGLYVVSFQYRLSNNTGNSEEKEVTPIDCVKDAKSAIRWLRVNAKKLGIDPEKIVAGGQSAGGQLAMATAMIDGVNEDTDNLTVSAVPNAVISWSGTVNTVEAWCDRLLGNQRNKIWSISPMHNLKAGVPPMIAFHGTEDQMVPFWTVSTFAEDMKRLGNDYELISYTGRRHYLGEGNQKYATYFDDEILERTDMFLRRLNLLNDLK